MSVFDYSGASRWSVVPEVPPPTLDLYKLTRREARVTLVIPQLTLHRPRQMRTGDKESSVILAGPSPLST